ncbi:hypothetical protein K4F52_000507 [Lecanicillium sp. MT-2017a]|nr:hypothetical protein K4F52_000507 [Lecanicillium sp. MT-2017a]
MVTQQAHPKRKRGRPSNASKAAEAAARAEAAQQDSDDDAPRPRKRGRPRKDAAPGPVTAAAVAKPTQRSSVANLLRGPNPNPRVAMDEPGEQSRRRGGAAARPSLGDVAPAEAQNKSARRRSDATGGKRGGARKSTGTARPATTTTTTNAAARKRMPQPQSGPGAVSRRREEPESPDEPSFMRPRPGEGDDEEEEEEADDQYPPSPPKSYPHVAPHIRRVRKSTIDTKWSKLGSGSIKALTSILQLARRPILQRLSNSEQRRTHTAKGLAIVMKRITDKTNHLPFPPASLPTRTKPGRPRGGRAEQDGGRETELNFESVLDAKQTLERQLDPVLHAVELLSGEVGRMEAEVEREYEALRGLDAEAKALARENRRLLKNAHPLTPAAMKGESSSGGGGGGDGDVAFEKMDEGGNPFEDIQNRQLHGVVAQLGRHTDSLLADQQQTDGISEQISYSRASLQALLAQRLGADEYERAVLGA